MSRSRVVILSVVIALISISITALVFVLLMAGPGSRAGEVTGAETVKGETRDLAFDPDQTLQVVVALQRLPRGFPIPANAYNNAVGVREWPAAAVPVDAVVVDDGQDPAQVIREQVVGRVVRTDIEREMPILRAVLAESLDDLAAVGSDTAALLPQGYVAISVPIDKTSGVAYGIQPGDRVDMIFSFLVVDVDDQFQSALPNWVYEIQYGALDDAGRTTASVLPVQGAALGRVDTIPPGELANIVPSEPQRPRLVSQWGVQNALVIYVGEFPPDGQIVGADASPPGPTAPRPDVVTLGVLPQEAVVINWAIDAQVDITLVVRSVSGVPSVATSSVTLQYIFETYNVPLPPRLPYSLEPSLRQPPVSTDCLPGSSCSSP